ncbi:hypothetical protein K7432_007597 [Basidiobolus ranarum]|uniref:Uncharacterized protein n=1 Tax=Basidiobolus ranarum TaxID=34480 RepID=A0ABR2VZU8_9FUNG
METINTAQEERRRMLEEFRKRKEELRGNEQQTVKKAPLSVVNSVRRPPATAKKSFSRVPYTTTPAQRVTERLPGTLVPKRLVLQQNHTRSLQSSNAQPKETGNASRFRTPANKSISSRTTSVATRTTSNRLTSGTLSSNLKSQKLQQPAHKVSPKTTRRSKLVHKKRSPMASRNSPRVNLTAHRVTQVSVRRGPFNDVTLTSLRKPAQRAEVPHSVLRTPRRSLKYATISTQTSPCMIVKLEPIDTPEPQEASKSVENTQEEGSENVASIVHKFHLIQKQQMVASKRPLFTIPTPKLLQVIDPITKEVLYEEFVPSRGISFLRLSKVIEYAKTGEVEATRAMFEILGVPPKSGTVHIIYTADYWIERSKFEEKCGNIDEALKLLQKGKEMKAKPAKAVKAAINSFISRHVEFRSQVETEPIHIRFQMDEALSPHLSQEDSIKREVMSESPEKSLGFANVCTMNQEASQIFNDNTTPHLNKIQKEDAGLFQHLREVNRSPFLSDDEDDIIPPVLESNVTFSEESDTEETNVEILANNNSNEFEDMTSMFNEVTLDECKDKGSVNIMTPMKVNQKNRGKSGASSVLTSVRRSARLLHMDSPATDMTTPQVDLEQQLLSKKPSGKRVETMKEQLEHEVEGDSSQLVYACITPSRKLRQSLDCNVVLTPVRRSARLARNADKLPPSLRHQSQTFNNLSELPEDMDFAWVPNDSVDVRKN